MRSAVTVCCHAPRHLLQFREHLCDIVPDMTCLQACVRTGLLSLPCAAAAAAALGKHQIHRRILSHSGARSRITTIPGSRSSPAGGSDNALRPDGQRPEARVGGYNTWSNLIQVNICFSICTECLAAVHSPPTVRRSQPGEMTGHSSGPATAVEKASLRRP